MNIPDFFPQDLRGTLAVAGFRAAIATKRPLLEALYGMVVSAREQAEAIEPVIAKWLSSEEGTRAAFNDPAKKERIWVAGAHRTLFSDSASALVLILDAEYERLHRRTGLSTLTRGMTTYVPAIYLSQAIRACANQYKHLAEWYSSPDRSEKDRAILAQLVGDPMREDAAAEFLRRGFRSYDDLSNAVLTVADNIITDGTVPAVGSAGIPTIGMRPTE